MQDKTRSPLLYVVGILSGLVLGAIILMPFSVMAMSYIVNAVHLNQQYGFYAIYVITLLLGVLGVMLSISRLSFLSGFITGAAVGLFGLAALCNSLMGIG